MAHNPNKTSNIQDISNDNTYDPSITKKPTTPNIKNTKTDQTSDSDAIKMEPNIVILSIKDEPHKVWAPEPILIEPNTARIVHLEMDNYLKLRGDTV